jgi:hypothetical protein
MKNGKSKKKKKITQTLIPETHKIKENNLINKLTILIIIEKLTITLKTIHQLKITNQIPH